MVRKKRTGTSRVTRTGRYSTTEWRKHIKPVRNGNDVKPIHKNESNRKKLLKSKMRRWKSGLKAIDAKNPTRKCKR